MSRFLNRFKKKNEFNPLSDEIPLPVLLPISWLKDNGGIDEPGLFRVSGSVAQITLIKRDLDRGSTKKFNLCQDHHVIAGVFKSFFGELSDSIMTQELTDCFLTAAGIPFEAPRIRSIKQAYDLLPPGNQAVLKISLEFMWRMSQNAEVNLMTVQNLAIVFAPTFLKQTFATMEDVVRNNAKGAKLLVAMITYYEELFCGKPLPEDDYEEDEKAQEFTKEFTKTLKAGTLKINEKKQMMKVQQEISRELASANPKEKEEFEEMADVLFHGNGKRAKHARVTDIFNRESIPEEESSSSGRSASPPSGYETRSLPSVGMGTTPPGRPTLNRSRPLLTHKKASNNMLQGGRVNSHVQSKSNVSYARPSRTPPQPPSASKFRRGQSEPSRKPHQKFTYGELSARQLRGRSKSWGEIEEIQSPIKKPMPVSSSPPTASPPPSPVMGPPKDQHEAKENEDPTDALLDVYLEKLMDGMGTSLIRVELQEKGYSIDQVLAFLSKMQERLAC